MVAAPTSTIDPHCSSGDAIPIEERAEDEVHFAGKTRLTPRGARAANPAFEARMKQSLRSAGTVAVQSPANGAILFPPFHFRWSRDVNRW